MPKAVPHGSLSRSFNRIIVLRKCIRRRSSSVTSICPGSGAVPHYVVHELSFYTNLCTINGRTRDLPVSLS